MERKRYVTMRRKTTNEQFFIDCKDPYNALKTAGQVHRMGENNFIQIRLRSTIPSKKKYKLIQSLDFIL